MKAYVDKKTQISDINETEELRIYHFRTQRYYRILVAGIFALIALFCICLLLGNYQTSICEVLETIFGMDISNSQIHTIVFLSRMPRAIVAILIGAALSMAGLVYQEIFNNQIVSPDILGVSSGSGVGAALGFLLGFNTFSISVLAFSFGIGTVVITISVSSVFSWKSKSELSLVLSGIVVSGLMSSVLGIIKCLSTNNQLASITFWLLGGLYNATYTELKIVAPIITLSLVTLLLLRWRIAIVGRGRIDAMTHGVNYQLVRGVVILLSTLLTAVTVSISGTIGWIGLMIPNLMRLLIGNNIKYLMPTTMIYGSCFALIADLLSRTISDSEIPLGIITGIIGSIMFIIIIIIRRKRERT